MSNGKTTKQDNRPSMQWYPDDWWAEVSLKLCSMAAQGLWCNMINIMFMANPRGKLMANGRQIHGKELAKILGQDLVDVEKWLGELGDNNVYSVDAEGCIYCRRMKRHWEDEKELHDKRAVAGRLGAEKRWKSDGKRIAKMAASSSTPSSTSKHTVPNGTARQPKKKRVRKKTTKDMAIKGKNAPTNQMIAVFIEEFTDCREGKPKIDAGKDGAICRKLWFECLANRPDDPLALWRERCRILMRERDIGTLGGISAWWNTVIPKKKEKTPYDVMRERAKAERQRDKELEEQIKKEQKEKA